MPSLPEFTDAEIAGVREMLVRMYRKEVDIQLTAADPNAAPGGGEEDPVPALYWLEQQANFVVFKRGPARFSARFFHTPREQFGTPERDYSALRDCVAAILKAHAEHSREQIDGPPANAP